MEETRSRWLDEAWLPIAAGLVWIIWAADAGWLVLAASAVPGSLLLTAGVSSLLWPGDARPRHFGALGALAGMLLGLVACLWAGIATGLGLAGLSLASAVAVGRLSMRAQRRSTDLDEVPVPAPTIRAALEVAADAAVLAQMGVFAPARALQSDASRVVDEVNGALDFFRARGFVEKPADYHRRPPPLAPDDVHATPARLRGVAYQHLRFDSGYEPWPDEPGRERYLDYAPCRTGHAWMLERDPGAPWLICLHGYQMGSPIMDFGAFRPAWLQDRLGLNLLMPVLPMHGPRKIRRVSGDGLLSGDLVDTVHAFAQTAWDLRRMVGWLVGRGAGPIGVYGLSLGGYSTALLASVCDSELACAIAGIPASDFARLSWLHGPKDELRRAEELGIGLGETTELKRVVSPLVLEPKVPHDRRFLFGGSADQLVPPDQVRDLWRHWGRPEIQWYPGAHVTFMAHPQVRGFIEGALRRSGLVG